MSRRATRRRDLDDETDLVDDRDDAEWNGRRLHPEVFELHGRREGRGRREVRAVALRPDVARDLLRRAVDGQIPGELEGERAARGEGEGEARCLGRDKLGLGGLTGVEG